MSRMVLWSTVIGIGTVSCYAIWKVFMQVCCLPVPFRLDSDEDTLEDGEEEQKLTVDQESNISYNERVGSRQPSNILLESASLLEPIVKEKVSLEVTTPSRTSTSYLSSVKDLLTVTLLPKATDCNTLSNKQPQSPASPMNEVFTPDLQNNGRIDIATPSESVSRGTPQTPGYHVTRAFTRVIDDLKPKRLPSTNDTVKPSEQQFGRTTSTKTIESGDNADTSSMLKSSSLISLLARSSSILSRSSITATDTESTTLLPRSQSIKSGQTTPTGSSKRKAESSLDESLPRGVHQRIEPTEEDNGTDSLITDMMASIVDGDADCIWGRQAFMSRIKIRFGSFDEPDSPRNVVHHKVRDGASTPILSSKATSPVEETSSEACSIRGATMMKLFERLLQYIKKDDSYVNTFMLTYRCFMSPSDLFDLLVYRYHTKSNDSATIRQAVFNVLQFWVQEHWYDFLDLTLRKRCVAFVDEVFLRHDKWPDAPALQMLVLKQIRVSTLEKTPSTLNIMYARMDTEAASQAIDAQQMVYDRLLTLDPDTWAQQWTLLEHRLFTKIRAHEFVAQAWSRQDKYDRAPRLLRKIDTFNRMSRMLTTAIVMRKAIKERGNLIRHFLRLAISCLCLHNYDAVVCIISSLQSAPVHRLKMTWVDVGDKVNQQLQDLSDLVTPKYNYRKYRQCLREVAEADERKACVPYIGMFLTDLTFIEDGNLDILETEDSLDVSLNSSNKKHSSSRRVGRDSIVNFEKRIMTAKVVQQIQKLQSRTYTHLKIDEDMQQWLTMARMTVPTFESIAADKVSTFLLIGSVLLSLLVSLVVASHYMMSKSEVLDPEKWQLFPLIEKIVLSPNTALYRFGLPQKNDVLGLPIGQHISVRATVDGKEVMRSYTPTSSANTKGHFDLVIKSYPNGNLSRYFSSLKVGDKVEVRGPKGAFKYRPNLVAHLCMIAGGTGITPMYQVLCAILNDTQDTTRISLIYANVNVEDILLKKELDELQAQHSKRFSIYYVLNNAPAGWMGGVGFVTANMISENCPAPSPHVKILLCGPPPMIRAMCDHCEALGYEKAKTISKMDDQVFKF